MSKSRRRQEKKVPDLPEHLRPRMRRHHNNRGYWLIKNDIVFQRLCRFAEKYGLRVVGAE